MSGSFDPKFVGKVDSREEKYERVSGSREIFVLVEEGLSFSGLKIKKTAFFFLWNNKCAPFETLFATVGRIDICQAHSIWNFAEKSIAARKSNKELVVREKSSF